MSLIETLLRTRTLVLLLGAIGGLGLFYILLSASRPVEAPWREVPVQLLTGEVAAFEPAEFPRGVPEIQIEGPDGEGVYLPEAVTGSVTLVNLWASWCAPCLEELPSLAALGAATQATILPVAQEGSSPSNRAAFEKAGVAGTLSSLRDPQLQLSRLYGGNDSRLPITVIYDGNGREVGRLTGAADWSSPEAVRLIEAIRADAATF